MYILYIYVYICKCRCPRAREFNSRKLRACRLHNARAHIFGRVLCGNARAAVARFPNTKSNYNKKKIERKKYTACAEKQYLGNATLNTEHGRCCKTRLIKFSKFREEIFIVEFNNNILSLGQTEKMLSASSVYNIFCAQNHCVIYPAFRGERSSKHTQQNKTKISGQRREYLPPRTYICVYPFAECIHTIYPPF